MAPQKKLCVCRDYIAVNPQGSYFLQPDYLAHVAARHASPTPSGPLPDKPVTIERCVAVEQHAIQAAARAVNAHEARDLKFLTVSISQIQIEEPDCTPEIMERLSTLSIDPSVKPEPLTSSLRNSLKHQNAWDTNLRQHLATVESCILILRYQLETIQELAFLEGMLTETRKFYTTIESVRWALGDIQKSRKHLLVTIEDLEKQLYGKVNVVKKSGTKPLYYDSGKF